MKPETVLRHEFVTAIPEQLEDGVVYVSIEFATVVHKCCCGCGHEVITPLTPTDWTLLFDGETVSLNPSVGSWNLPCQSHYWIRRNRVQWARPWTREQIEAGRAADTRAKAHHYGAEPPILVIPQAPVPPTAATAAGTPPENAPKPGFWRRIKRWLGGA